MIPYFGLVDVVKFDYGKTGNEFIGEDGKNLGVWNKGHQSIFFTISS